jgi:hypothetical protein
MGRAALVLLLFFTGLGTATAQNPLPFVDQPLVPDTVMPGGPAFTLTVNGSGFVSGAMVNWNGAPLQTTFVSGSKLTAAVPAGNVAAAGTASITVNNPAPGSLILSASPALVAPGDFNGDGILDLAIENNPGNAVTILLGKGDGTFIEAPASPVTVGSVPQALAVGDFNGDANLDIAVTTYNGTSGGITILLGKGDGTFAQAAGSPISMTGSPMALAVGDLNSDGRLDVTFVNYIGNVVDTLLGNGDGTFTLSPSPTAPGVGPSSFATGDFNTDGRLDLAVTTATAADNTISILLQQPPGPIASLSMGLADFGDQLVGTTSAPQAITLTNKGNASLNLTASTTSGDFAVAASATTCSTSTTVEVGASCTIGVIFTPTALGTRTGSLSITDDSNGTTGSTQTVSLSGTGANVGASVTPSFLAFPFENVGTPSAAQTVTLTNTGQTPVNISSISISSGFSQSNNCGSSLAVASSCTFSVTFVPTVGGLISGTLIITDDAVGSPQTVSLAGSALDFALAGAPTSLTVTPGGTASYALQISSAGGFYGGVMLACSGAPSNSTCSVTPSSVSLNGTSAVNATLTVATEAPSLLGPLAPSPHSLPPMLLWIILAVLSGLVAMPHLAPNRIHFRKTPLVAPAVLLILAVL